MKLRLTITVEYDVDPMDYPEGTNPAYEDMLEFMDNHNAVSALLERDDYDVKVEYI